MESPQSPHSSSLWVFALSAVESYRPLPPVPISRLGTKLSSTVLLLFGLRVISETEGLLDEVKETDKLLDATEIEAGGRLEDCAEGWRLLKGRGQQNDIVHNSRKKMRIDVAAGILN